MGRQQEEVLPSCAVQNPIVEAIGSSALKQTNNKHSWFQFSMSMSDRKIAALAADIFSLNVRVSFLCSSNIWFRPEIHA